MLEPQNSGRDNASVHKVMHGQDYTAGQMAAWRISIRQAREHRHMKPKPPFLSPLMLYNTLHYGF
jgi:hypothetical protein